MGPRRDQAAGIHHIVCRGNNKRPIFGDGGERAWFLHLLNQIARDVQWSIHAYALMTNHYHLLLRLEHDDGLGAGMCELNTAYATWFNKREKRLNHLFGRRYWSERMKDERRYFAALRYVVRNPARAGQRGLLTEHTWSSFAASLGLDEPPIRLARDEVLGMFDPRPVRAVFEYRVLCESPDGPAYSRKAVRGRPVSRGAEIQAA
jgi:putative transposase